MNLIDTLAGVSDIVSKHWPPPQQPKPKKCTATAVPTIDVVVPTCGGEFHKGVPTLGLLMTLSSCEEVLKDSGFDYKYFIVSNGNPATGDARDSLNLAFEYAKGTGHLAQIFDVPQGLTPPGARNMGAAAGSGEYIVFLDDHCRVYEGFFSETVDTFTSTDAGSVRGVTICFYKNFALDLFTIVCSKATGEIPYFHRVLNFDHPFWGDVTPFQFGPIGPLIKPLAKLLVPGAEDQTYRIASAGHGAFAVRRSVWNDVGGYWDGLKGFGCEEVYFDLKLALLDHSIYLNPRIRHWHQMYSEKPYSRTVTQITLENMMAVANVLGGPEWAQKVLKNSCDVVKDCDREKLTNLLTTAIARSDVYAQWCASRRKRTLEEQLELFRKEAVAM